MEERGAREVEIMLASPPYREKLVAQLWVEDFTYALAEIDQDGPRPRIEFYDRGDGKPWQLEYEEVVTALSEAKAAPAELLSVSDRPR
jgi:hypothetical protein